MVDLVQNPILDTTAHGHEKNHSLGIAQLLGMIDHAKTVESCLLSIYAGLSYPTDSFQDPFVNWQQVKNFHREEFQQIWQSLLEFSDYHIHIANDSSIPLYHHDSRIKNNWIDASYQTSNSVAHVDEKNQNWIELFFQHSIQQWQNLGLTQRWDVRERLAIDIRPHEVYVPTDLADYTRPHLWINCIEFWTQGEQVLQKVFDYLELKLCQEKLEHWQKVYHKWQQIQLVRMSRNWQIPKIVTAIVNNHYYVIPKLTLLEEALVQHFLIYQHSLNLKTWQLEYFPDNAQQLHQLLETNHHPVEKLY